MLSRAIFRMVVIICPWNGIQYRMALLLIQENKNIICLNTADVAQIKILIFNIQNIPFLNPWYLNNISIKQISSTPPDPILKCHGGG